MISGIVIGKHLIPQAVENFRDLSSRNLYFEKISRLEMDTNLATTMAYFFSYKCL